MFTKFKKLHATMAALAVLVLVAVTVSCTVFANSKSSSLELPADISASVTLANSWSSGEYNYYQLQLNLKNNSSSEINDWEFLVDLPEGSSLNQDWSGIGKIEDNRLSVTPVSYNTTIYPGGEVSYGCIFYTSNTYERQYEALRIGANTYVLNGNGDSDVSNDINDSNDIVVSDSVVESDDTTEETSAISNDVNELPSSYSYNINIVSSWSDGSKYYSQLQVVLANNSGKNIESWELALELPEGTTFSQGWCADFSMSGSVLSIKPMDYNKAIYANNSMENIGFMLTSTTEIKDINSIVTIDSQSYAVGSGSDFGTGTPSQDTVETTTEKETEKATETTTEAATQPVVTPSVPSNSASGTPVAVHGKLSVSGTNIVDQNGDIFQLRGVSTHGIAWYPQYINSDAFATWENYGANVMRLALYSDPNAGFSTSLYSQVDNGVQYATELGMYVIIDWHILSDGNPNTYKSSAESFFREMSAKYANYDNVLYEICNEPNGCSWDSDIKPYAEDIIDIIRANDDDAIIIVGTPTWSQDVDVVSNNPIKGESNIVYALHFYAATHTDYLRNKLQTALNNGLPVFVSEFGMCDASGNGGNNLTEAEKWITMLDSNNISYVCWNLSNKNETSALISSSCTTSGNWSYSDLSESGKWFATILQQRK